MNSSRITVIKRNLAGEETWRYEGSVLQLEEHAVVLEAFFDREDLPMQGVMLKRGDRFVEKYFTDRWYNVFRIQDRDDGQIKGWYCNIGLPAVLEADDRLSYVDLALDLWVTPQGKQTVLDEDEFEQLPLNAQMRVQARAALAELQGLFNTNRPPI